MNNKPEEKIKKSKHHLIIWAICFAVPVFIATLYIMYMVVLAYLFSTRSIHGSSSPFPTGIYIIPWVVAIIAAILFGLIGWFVGKKFSNKKHDKTKTTNIVTFAILTILIIICSVVYIWQRITSQALQRELNNLQNININIEGITFPDYVASSQVSKIIRLEADPNFLYALSKPLPSFYQGNSEYFENFPETFRGIIKSSDNGKTWDKIYEAENDIIDLELSGKDLFAITVARYGGGGGEIYIKVITSQDGGGSWTLSSEIAKNDSEKITQSQPFTLNSISNIIVDSNNPNKSYILYKDNFGSDSFDKMIYTEDHWNTSQRKDL